MRLLIEALWPGLAAGLLLGLGMGALAGLPRDRAGWLAAGVPVALFAILSVPAMLRSLPGEAGLWVETATLMLASYLAGCVLGGLAKHLAGGARSGIDRS